MINKKALGLLIFLMIVMIIVNSGFLAVQTGMIVLDRTGESVEIESNEVIEEGTQENMPGVEEDEVTLSEWWSEFKSSRKSSKDKEETESSEESENSGETEIPEITEMKVSSNSAKVGESFTTEVSIASKESIYAADFYLSFNPEIIEAISASQGNFMNKDGKSTYPIISINNKDGKIIFAITRMGQVGGVSGSGILARINFKAIKKGKSAITISEASISDTTLDDKKFRVEIENGEANIS
ncbi:hypothetical protein HYW76_05000 [Candidatus Pacearchaeota archaeon]|nr:hypothetical protein [Candidatus Pacearchaeota archaeon]